MIKEAAVLRKTMQLALLHVHSARCRLEIYPSHFCDISISLRISQADFRQSNKEETLHCMKSGSTEAGTLVLKLAEYAALSQGERAALALRLDTNEQSNSHL